jgi:hypothetical protein
LKIFDHLPVAGRVLFAIALVAMGVQNIEFKGFIDGLRITPDWLFWHTFWAYLDGALMMGGGVMIAIDKKAKLGATLIGLVYGFSFFLVRVPRITHAVRDLGERGQILEVLAIGCGAFLIAKTRGPWRILFGLAMILFGYDHFPILSFIAKLIPEWIPGRMFWAAFTGAAMMAAGVSIITKWHVRMGTALLGLMFFLWVVLLHGPRVAADVHNVDEWNSLFIALAMCGSSWVLTEVE